MKSITKKVFEVGDRVWLDYRIAAECYLTPGPHRIISVSPPESDLFVIFIEGFEDGFAASCFTPYDEFECWEHNL